MPLVFLDSDFETADKILATSLSTLRKAITEAIAEERKRCVEIALALDSGRGNEKAIAEAIVGVRRSPQETEAPHD